MDTIDESKLSQQNGRHGNIKVEFDNNVAQITMDCGENRVNIDFVRKFHKALDIVERNDDAHVLITTSHGKFYSNGFDLNWMAILNQKELAQFEEAVYSLVWRLATFPLPTIAAVNGHAMALGAFLTLAQDYIIMNSEKGWWSFNEVHNNFLFPGFYNQLLKYRLPSGPVYHRAAVMGHRFTAKELVDEHLAENACEASQVLPRAKEFAYAIVNRGPYNRESLKNMKTDLYIQLKSHMQPFIAKL